MYAKFYGLAVEPFSLSPDPRFCYRHPSFARAKAYFEFAIHRGEGFVVVTGRPGTGKTTLIQDLVRDLRKSSLLVARIDRTQVEADDLLRLVAYAFGIDARGADKASLLHDIEHLLRRRAGPRNRAILIVDEAQNLPPAALEELRLITNLHDRMVPLVQIFLVGQEELRTSIRHPSLEQLHQRIVAACHIEPLNPEEMRGYVQHRLLCAGWQGDPAICGQALGLIHVATRGIPRLVNKFCDRLLVHGSIEGRHVLTVEDAHLVLAELRQEYLNPQDAPLGDLLRQGGTPQLADLGFDPAELSTLIPPSATDQITGGQSAGADSPDTREPASDVSAVEPPRVYPDPTIEALEPAASALPTHQPRPRRLRHWAAAAVLLLTAGVGYWLIGPQRLGELRELVLMSTERWLPAPQGAELPFRTGSVAEGSPTEPVAELEVTPLVALASTSPTTRPREVDDQDHADPALDSWSETPEPAAADLAAAAALVAQEAAVGLATAAGSPAGDPAREAPAQSPSESPAVAEIAPAPEPLTWAELPPPDTDRLALTGDEPLLAAPSTTEVTADSASSPAPQYDLAALAEALAALGLGVAEHDGDEVQLDLVAEVPFGIDSASIPASSVPILRDLALVLAGHPGTRIRVIGHTDRSGPSQHNRELSLRRAEAVVAQLAGEGVARERLVAEGRGMEEPLLAADGNPVFRRRVELRIEPQAAPGPGTAANLDRLP